MTELTGEHRVEKGQRFALVAQFADFFLFRFVRNRLVVAIEAHVEAGQARELFGLVIHVAFVALETHLLGVVEMVEFDGLGYGRLRFKY